MATRTPKRPTLPALRIEVDQLLERARAGAAAVAAEQPPSGSWATSLAKGAVAPDLIAEVDWMLRKERIDQTVRVLESLRELIT